MTSRTPGVLHLRVGRRTVALGACAVALLGTLGCTSAVLDGDPFAAAPPPEAAESIADARPLAAVVEPVHTTEALPQLPIPEPLPTDPYAPTPEVVIGHIAIPAIGLDDDLHQGMTLTAINRGPSHWPGTALPGQMGNMVIAGHRTTYSRPFLDLDRIVPGDQMVVTAVDGSRYSYVATGTEVVTPDAMWLADQSEAFTATTFACHPKGSARERIAVRWQLIDDDGVPVPPST